MFVAVSKLSTYPKLCHKPSETAGNNTPLLPQRLYFIEEYLFSEGIYAILIFNFSQFQYKEAKVVLFKIFFIKKITNYLFYLQKLEDFFILYLNKMK